MNETTNGTTDNPRTVTRPPPMPHPIHGATTMTKQPTPQGEAPAAQPPQAANPCPDCKVRRLIGERALERHGELLARAKAAETELSRLREMLALVADQLVKSGESSEKYAFGLAAKADLDAGGFMSAESALVVSVAELGVAKSLRDLLSLPKEAAEP